MNRESFLELLGSLPNKSPLDVQIIEEIDCGSYTRQKITFCAETNEIIPAYLCTPKGSGPFPAIYCHHQHGGNYTLGKSEVVGLAGSPDQRYAAELAEQGYVTLSPDALAFEERSYPDDPRGFHVYQMTTRLIRGQTLLGKVLFDLSAGIDLLASLKNVDPERIGFIGHSYGGRMALFAPVFDRRIKVSVCSCGSTTFRDMLKHDTGIQNDFVVPNILATGDLDDVIRLIEPAHLMILAADQDKWSLSTDQIRATAAGAFKNGTLDIRTFSGLHTFPDAQRQQAYKFIGAHLRSVSLAPSSPGS
jgi:dienelactone hydrolase